MFSFNKFMKQHSAAFLLSTEIKSVSSGKLPRKTKNNLSVFFTYYIIKRQFSLMPDNITLLQHSLFSKYVFENGS